MRTSQRIALIGYGAVSQAVLRHLAAHQMEVLCVLLRPGWKEKKRAEPPRPLRFVDDAGEMLSLGPEREHLARVVDESQRPRRFGALLFLPSGPQQHAEHFHLMSRQMPQHGLRDGAVSDQGDALGGSHLVLTSVVSQRYCVCE